MPRVAGQIDRRKAEAVLDAASTVFAERGLGASLEAVAAAAGVSKQTIYNQYGSKADLIRALVERRSAQLTAPLDEAAFAGRPVEALAALARTLLKKYIGDGCAPAQLMRVVIQHAAEEPELARLVYEAGPRTSRRRLAAFLEAENAAGRLKVGDAVEAAELFLGMVTGPVQLRALLGLSTELTPADTERRARACAERFVRAYAP